MAVLDAYGVSQAHLVGMSLGGYLAQINALRHPERVLSLTLIASEPFGISYEAEGIGDDFMAHFGAMASLDWADRDAVAAFLLKIAELSSGTRDPFDRRTALDRIEGELSRTSSMQSAFNHSMMAGSIDLHQTAADLHCPVLVIHGSDDPVISVNAAYKSVQVGDRSCCADYPAPGSGYLGGCALQCVRMRWAITGASCTSSSCPTPSRIISSEPGTTHKSI